jgi:hypothetical protein
MVPTSRELSDLRSKYTEMLRLRLEDQAGSGGDPRRSMAALAGKFPGALREIDELPLDTIRARIAALEAAETDAGLVEPWMQAMARFHALLRGALCVKRWLAGRSEVDAKVARAFVVDVESLCYADDARAWALDLARLASPPRGRVTELVYERVAKELAVTEEAARLLVFGPSRRARRKGGDVGGKESEGG